MSGLCCSRCRVGGVRLWRRRGEDRLACAACALDLWGVDLVEHPRALDRAPELRAAWFGLPVARSRCRCGDEAVSDGELFWCSACDAVWTEPLVDEGQVEEAIALGGEPLAVAAGGRVVARAPVSRWSAFAAAGWVFGAWPEALRAASRRFGWVKEVSDGST